MSTEDEQKKAILPFLQRADEIEAVEPKVAYYCRMCAVDTGISFGSARAPKIDGVIRALVTKLERDKPSAQLSANDGEYCRSFAETVFARADRVDRAGRADKSTAMTFYAASIFIEVLRQFGELPQDLMDMQKYAAWKAADINKALREGRQPMPGNSSSPADEDAARDAAPSTQHAAVEPDFAFPSAPRAAPADAPRFPGGGTQAPTVPSVSGRPPRDPSYNVPSAPPPVLESAPSTVSSEAEGLVGSASADYSEADTDEDQPRYVRGQKVLYDAFDQSSPVRGTVAKVHKADGKWQYAVALQDRIISVFEHILAPDFEPGDSVIYRSPEGNSMPASVVQTDASHWRPTYIIRTQDGVERNTLDDRILKFAPASARMPSTTRQAEATRSALLPGSAPVKSAAGPQSAAPSALHLADAKLGQQVHASHLPQPSMVPGQSQSSRGVPTPPMVMPSPVPGFEPSLTAVSEAQKHARQAASALGFEDVQTAIKNLSDALKLLTQP